MDCMTLVTALSGTIGRPKANTWCSVQAQFDGVTLTTPIFSCFEDISCGVKFYSWSHDLDHAPFSDGLSPTGCDMLW